MDEQTLARIEEQLLQHEDCVHPGAPRSVSIHPVIPVWAVLEVLRAGDGVTA